jgi:hypothetical protein
MSYQSQTLLADDQDFQQRVKACCVQQANTFKDDADPGNAQLAGAVVRDQGAMLTSFYNTSAASPGFADKVDQGDGTVDSSLVLDPEILSTVQAVWPIVAGAYYPPA